MKFYFLILTVLFCSVSTAQIKDPSVITPSPNASEMGRFSAMPVGLFTGTAQYNIPIFEFKTPNITLPITLDYSSNGLIVDKIASWVGFDWSLNAGGVINRYRKKNVDKPGIRPSFPTNFETWSASVKLAFFESYTFDTTDNDLEPDEFVFSFLNYSGKFVFDESGNPVLIPYSNLKIETNTTGGAYNYFNITTPDGVIFKFEETAVTYPIVDPSYISSWYLKQIIHPLGDVVTFNYTRITLDQYSGVTQSASVSVASANGSSGCPSPTSTTKVNSLRNEVLFLSNIDFQSYGKIVFESSQNRDDSYLDYRLERIKILDSSNNLKKSFQFFYQFPLSSSNYPSGTTFGLTETNNQHSKRMFLDSLQIQNNIGGRVNSYAFLYNNLNQLPARYSFSQDHWGYFNGKSNTDFALLSEVPLTHQNFFTSVVPTNANREPDYNYSQKGMLQKIVFPTGGYTTIEYEPNKDGFGNPTGGCRVLRTKTYKNITSSAEIKKYLYPSATYTGNYKYYREITNFTSTGSCTIGLLSSQSFYNLIINGKYHVFYPTVEILDGENSENGKEVHSFQYNQDITASPTNGQLIYPLIKYSNDGIENGKLIDQKFLNNAQTCVWEKNISYNSAETRNKKVINCLAVERRDYFTGQILTDDYKVAFFDVERYFLYSSWYYINQEQVTKYHAGGNVVSTTNYFYDNAGHAQLSREETLDSQGDTIRKLISYPKDYNLTASNFAVLRTKHIDNAPVDIRKYVNTKLVEGQQIKYNDYGQPTDVYTAETNGSNITIDAANPYTLTHKALYTYYDIVRNIKEITKDNNITTTYLWGYNQTYPVAKIENASLLEVQTALGGSIPDLGSSGLTQTQITSLRTGLVNAQITTYTYTPLVGMTSQTDPNGKSTFYEYDSFGRLRLIKDNDGKILKKYDYHYATANQ